MQQDIFDMNLSFNIGCENYNDIKCSDFLHANF